MLTGARWTVWGALALAICILGPHRAAAGSVATAGSPARVSVAIPPAAVEAGVVMLEIGIATARRPASGHLGAVVRLMRPDGSPVELGRISVMAGGQQRYQFNVAGALKRVRGGSAEIEVELIDRGSGSPLASGAELAVGRARIVTR
jgi:hypothetical protein